MIVSARGPRRNRVWVEVRARLGRDAGASGARHVRTRERVRQELVGHGSSTSQPYTSCMAGQNVVSDCDFKRWGLCSLSWFSKKWVVVLFCSSYKSGERHPAAPCFSCRCKKKLIVSRQPIFTNLKSNTMKNSAKVHEILKTCKQQDWKLAFFKTIFCGKMCSGRRRCQKSWISNGEKMTWPFFGE